MVGELAPRRRTLYKGDNRGFTLIEVLVVVAIIVTLAAILYPVLIQAKDSARMKSCASNLRQMGSAFRLYVDDYNGYALPIQTGNYSYMWVANVHPLMSYLGQGRQSSQSQGSTGASQVQRQIPSVSSRSVWICPGDVRRGTELPLWVNAGSSYMYPAPGAYVNVWNPPHPWWGLWKGIPQVGAPRKVDQWAKPQRDMLFGDFYNYFHRRLSPPPDQKLTYRYDRTTSARSMNLLMLDMHVTTACGEDLIGPQGLYQKYLLYVLEYDNRYSKSYNPSVVLAL